MHSYLIQTWSDKAFQGTRLWIGHIAIFAFEITRTFPLIHLFVICRAGVYILPFFKSRINTRINLALNLSYIPKHFLTISAFPCFTLRYHSHLSFNRVGCPQKNIWILFYPILTGFFEYDYIKHSIKLNAKHLNFGFFPILINETKDLELF